MFFNNLLTTFVSAIALYISEMAIRPIFLAHHAHSWLHLSAYVAFTKFWNITQTFTLFGMGKYK